MASRERDDESGRPEPPVPLETTERIDIDEEEPWGVSEDSPMDEGSEETAVTEGQRGELRAAASDEAEQPSLGPMEPTPTPEAGPGGPPDPAPARRSFPANELIDDLPDDSIERQTGGRHR